jgi:hypothetical protein
MSRLKILLIVPFLVLPLTAALSAAQPTGSSGGTMHDGGMGAAGARPMFDTFSSSTVGGNADRVAPTLPPADNHTNFARSLTNRGCNNAVIGAPSNPIGAVC